MDETSAQIGALKAEIANLKLDVDALRDDVKQLLAIMNAGRGAWRTLAVLGAAAIAIGGLAIAVYKVFKP